MKLSERFYEIWGLTFEGAEERTYALKDEIAQLEATLDRSNKQFGELYGKNLELKEKNMQLREENNRKIGYGVKLEAELRRSQRAYAEIYSTCAQLEEENERLMGALQLTADIVIDKYDACDEPLNKAWDAAVDALKEGDDA